MAQVCIAVIHGMGSQRPGYSRPMRDEINRRLGLKAARVSWREIYWADILESREREFLRDANADNELDWLRLRRFMLRAFGDASAYRRTGDACSSAYCDIHARIRDAIAALDPGEDAPLIVMAHSLGGHIMSNYIWDMQQGRPIAPPGDSPFQRLETLAGLITFGCNIPLFTLAWRKSDIHPIRFPGQALDPAARQRARWLNFFDPDDVPRLSAATDQCPLCPRGQRGHCHQCRRFVGELESDVAPVLLDGQRFHPDRGAIRRKLAGISPKPEREARRPPAHA